MLHKKIVRSSTKVQAATTYKQASRVHSGLPLLCTPSQTTASTNRRKAQSESEFPEPAMWRLPLYEYHHQPLITCFMSKGQATPGSSICPSLRPNQILRLPASSTSDAHNARSVMDKLKTSAGKPQDKRKHRCQQPSPFFKMWVCLPLVPTNGWLPVSLQTTK